MCEDHDGDGATVCYGGFNCSPACTGDCNDNPNNGGDLQFPGNPESCDGIDNNCNGQWDEGNVCPPLCEDAFQKPFLLYACPYPSTQDDMNTNYCCPHCDGEPFACDTGQGWSFLECQCVNASPIIVDVVGNGFSLTDKRSGVQFDLTGRGERKQTSWTARNSDDAFLALDVNRNGAIDNGRELFGNFTAQPKPSPGTSANGFLALAQYDRPENGGNGDGVIDALDSVFNYLRLWQDTNHDGISHGKELHKLSDLGVRKIDLDYSESKRTDVFGNQFRYRSRVRDSRDTDVGKWAWDVFLLTD